jgi:anti-anti-sigma regulatory factor
MDFKITSDDGKNITLFINGRIEQQDSDSLTKQIEKYIENGALSITVDMGQCNSITSYGALMLYQLKDKLDKKNISFEIIKIRDEVKTVLSLMKFL